MLMHKNFDLDVLTKVNNCVGLKIYSEGYNILILIEKIWQKRKGKLFQP
jgi:hypothetical protein